MYTKIQRMLNSNEQAYQMVQGSGKRKPIFLIQTRVQHFSNLRRNLARLWNSSWAREVPED
jgi:conjugal transfer/entry exclusion protein